MDRQTSMTASAGFSQPCEEITSTNACNSLMDSSRTKFRSNTSSPEMLIREKWVCSRMSAFMAGSSTAPATIFHRYVRLG